jgi:glutathione-regulated potassium-efflux system protein KefB
MSEAAHTGGYLVSVLIFLGAAVLAVPLFRLLGLGAVIGYLFAGVAIGPSGFGFIGDAGTTREIAELGVVLLLFIVGLELKPSRLMSMRRDILLLGSSQMAVTALIVGGLASATFKVPFWGAATTGVALAFSATAIALQLLEERGALQSSYGRRAFAVLLMQDILVVPVLALVPLAASRAPVFSGQIQETLAGLSASGAALAVVIFSGG